jgi:mannose-6-phosphate isomerase-like protein (cupin superfamily)
MARGDHYKTAWPSKARKVPRSWGHELWIGSLGTATMKALYLKKDEKTSLKYYKHKNEVLFIRAGRVTIEYDSEKYLWQDHENRKLKNVLLAAGDVFFVQSSCPYRITAVEDSEIFEIGDAARDTSVKIDEPEET